MITNAQLMKAAKVLFAHTNAYNLPATFANRTDSREFLYDSLAGRKHDVIVISDILGSGKTFLSTMVRNELQEAGEVAFEQQPKFCGKISRADLSIGEPIFVDEWDIKAKPADILQTLEILMGFSSDSQFPLVVLGDYTLKSTWLSSQLRELGSMEYVSMEPLNPVFFGQALESRRVRAAASMGAELMDFKIISEEVSAALVPNWKEITCANFRETFSTLSEMANKDLDLRETTGINIGVLSNWLMRQEIKLRRISNKQLTFLTAYSEFLTEIVAKHGWEQIKPMTSDELFELVDFGISIEAFRAEVLYGLVKGRHFIVSVGNPEIDPSELLYDKFPEPYLPGIALRAEIAVSLSEEV